MTNSNGNYVVGELDEFLVFIATIVSLYITMYYLFQVREMDKRKEGNPGEARASLRCSVRDNG